MPFEISDFEGKIVWKFDVSPTVTIFVKTKQNKNFEKDFKWPEMQLSDIMMKIQTQSG